MTGVPRASDAGFTLIEALVAMVILGLGAVSLMTAAEGYTRRITDVTERVAARWVAENALVAAQLGLDDANGLTRMYGQGFDVRWDLADTQDADLKSITFEVSDEGSDRILFVLDGFVAAQAAL